MKQSKDVMFAKLKGFKADIGKLKNHFEEHVKSIPAVQYRDNRVDYIGWAVTSRDGSMEDGVKRISLNPPSDSKQAPASLAVVPTMICTDYLSQVINELGSLGLKPYRARIMQLESEGDEMPLHTDANKEAWRLHIPIVTNPNCFFEWQRTDGSMESVHLPADGSAWLVRVDVAHRAVNHSKQPSNRVHLLMGLGAKPEFSMLDEPWLPVVA